MVKSLVQMLIGCFAAKKPAGGRRRWYPHLWHLGRCGWGVGSVAAAIGLTLAQGSLRTNLGGPGWPALIPVGMLAFGLLFTVPFWAEVRHLRSLLLALLQLQATPGQRLAANGRGQRPDLRCPCLYSFTSSNASPSGASRRSRPTCGSQ